MSGNGIAELNDILSSNSSSDDEGDDEAEKFKNTFLNKKNLLFTQGRQ